MNLADRISRLEAKLRPVTTVVPVFMVTMDTGDTEQPYFIEHDGQTWTQQIGETLESLQERAKAEAVQAFRPTGKFPSLLLVAKRPSLTKEKWLERYGSSKGSYDPEQ